jgi:hypothetical protein
MTSRPLIAVRPISLPNPVDDRQRNVVVESGAAVGIALPLLDLHRQPPLRAGPEQREANLRSNARSPTSTVVTL